MFLLVINLHQVVIMYVHIYIILQFYCQHIFKVIYNVDYIYSKNIEMLNFAVKTRNEINRHYSITELTSMAYEMYGNGLFDATIDILIKQNSIRTKEV